MIYTHPSFLSNKKQHAIYQNESDAVQCKKALKPSLQRKAKVYYTEARHNGRLILVYGVFID